MGLAGRIDLAAVPGYGGSRALRGRRSSRRHPAAETVQQIGRPVPDSCELIREVLTVRPALRSSLHGADDSADLLGERDDVRLQRVRG